MELSHAHTHTRTCTHTHAHTHTHTCTHTHTHTRTHILSLKPWNHPLESDSRVLWEVHGPDDYLKALGQNRLCRVQFLFLLKDLPHGQGKFPAALALFTGHSDCWRWSTTTPTPFVHTHRPVLYNFIPFLSWHTNCLQVWHNDIM